MLTAIIDVSKYELGANVAEAAQQGLVALWAKATQGRDYVDHSYFHFRDDATAAGLLFGSYHFGSASTDGVTQADWFLANCDHSSLLCLDWEMNPGNGGTMDLERAEQFVERIHDVTGRWPVLYSGRSFLFAQKVPKTSPLANCPLWLAQYGNRPTAIPPAWSKYDLWQYSDYHSHPDDLDTYPRDTPGLGRLVDRSCFDGDLDALKAWWSNCGRAQ